MINDGKVVLIGLDGGTLDLMEPWMDSGRLPNFDKIRNGGCYGTLQSTTPPYSAPAWTSIVTGCHPGKHGIYDFFKTNNPLKKIASSRDRKVPAIWRYMSDVNKKSIVVAVPGTYPPEKINGYMITGLLTPSPKSTFTHPADLKEKLVESDVGEYLLEQFGVDDIPKILYSRYSPQKLANKINQSITSHANVTMNLMEKYDWDFSIVVFRGTDDAQHLLWNHKDLVLSCYQTADEYIGKMMNKFTNATYILVSDHGFTALKKYLYVNNVLYNAGFLKTYSDPKHNLKKFTSFVFGKFTRQLFQNLPMDKLVRTSFGRKIILSGSSAGEKIDFLQSKAVYHSVCSRGIRILLKNKYKQGIVEKDDYERLREQLIALFKEIKDPESGLNIVKKVYRWEEIYGQKAVNDPLDIILDLELSYGTLELLRQPGKLRSSESQKDILSVIGRPDFRYWSGDHSSYGIIFIYGENVKKNKIINASVLDIVPTVLGLMDLPIPEIIDGDIINSAFEKKLKIKYIDWNKEFRKEKSLTDLEIKAIARVRKQF